MLQENTREGAPKPPADRETSKTTALLVGLPNAGKSTIFNLLTGGNRKVSNYSGITVDMARGNLISSWNEQDPKNDLEIIDLPGIYHLNPTSLDEGVTVSKVFEENSKTNSKIILVLDWQRMSASLGLASAILEKTSDRTIVLINKDDANEVDVHYRQNLEQKLGVPVFPLSALEIGLEALSHFITEGIQKPHLKGEITPNNEPIPLTPLGASFLPKEKLLQNQQTKVSGPFEVIEGAQGEKKVADFINRHLQLGRSLISNKDIEEKITRANHTEKIDNIVLNPILGGFIFLAVFYFLFNSIYTWAGPLMDLTEGAILTLGDVIGSMLPSGLLKSMIVDGIFAGVGGVVIFLPQIMILFFLMSLLEQSGYIARAALIVDRFMSFFGLGGKAFLPYLSGYACAIPGIMAARTIPDTKERYATIMTLPLITCSARIPVYVLLIGTFVPSTTVFGIFNSQALAFFFLYFLGSFMALVMAKVFRLSFFKGENSQFLMDLPRYQRPSLKAALRQSWIKGKSFLKKAGTIILGLSLIIWLLSTFPQYQTNSHEGLNDNEVAARQLEHSALGRMGKVIEPAITPLGMDWKIGVGLLVSFGARELFVSAMGTLYALGEADEESEGLRERLLSEKDPITGKPIFDFATAWSILFFFVFGLQCTSTLAILKKESGGWKVPVVTFGYMFLLAYTSSFLVYQVLS